MRHVCVGVGVGVGVGPPAGDRLPEGGARRGEARQARCSAHLGRGTTGSGDLDGLLAAVVRGLDHVLNSLALLQGAETVGDDGSLVDKQVLATCGGNR